MSDHTPTPWVLDEDCFDEDEVEITSQSRLDDSLVEIATVKVGGFDEDIEALQRANAAFILRAVNAHDDLVAALNMAREWVKYLHNEASALGEDAVVTSQSALDQITAAIAKAEALS